MTPARAHALILACCVLVAATPLVSARCMSDDSVENFFKGGNDDLPLPGSCCQMDICGIPCPAETPKPDSGYGIGVGIIVLVFCLVGFATFYFVGGKAENFFVAGRSLPLFVVTMTLSSQSIDSNALLGNADLSYKFHFYDGAVLPIGLGLSLIINGLTLAHHMNNENVLTLPDVYAKRYGVLAELAVSLCTCVSFLCLLAGNLVGMSVILGYLFDMSVEGACFLAGFIVLAYTACGGLFSVAYTDVFQSSIGMVGCLVCTYWLINNAEEWAPPPSIGMPKSTDSDVGFYTYPNEEIAKMYDGVPCEHDPTAWCYNQAKWCPDADNCRADNGAYPFGDKRVFSDQMTNPYALTPFPNALFWDWATIFILGFGNLAALDFQARCMAAKTPNTARIGCIIGGLLTFFVGIPFSYMGAITRYYYGPDSIHAEFEADTCSKVLDLPTCGMWKPDAMAFIKVLTTVPPGFIGGWCLLGIVAASMSTSDGAILALGTVFANNIVRNIPKLTGSKVTWINDKNLLLAARISTVPFAVIAILIAAFYQSDHPQGATGYLLIVAFDVVLAGCVVPLFACFYVDKPSPNAGLLAIIGGSLLRVILEFSLPKDGYLLLPWKGKEHGDDYLDYGTPTSTGYPGFFDVPATDKWDASAECKQERFRDFTGVDSLSAPLFSLLIFVVVHFAEKARGRPLFVISETLMAPVDKSAGAEAEAEGKLEKGAEMQPTLAAKEMAVAQPVAARAETVVPQQWPHPGATAIMPGGIVAGAPGMHPYPPPPAVNQVNAYPYGHGVPLQPAFPYGAPMYHGMA